jgi:hypothetical protein
MIGLKHEVKELTELFRNDWIDIQQIAIENNLEISKTYLFSFIESENEDETCLFYTLGKGFFYEKKVDATFFNAVEKNEIENEFPQVQTVVDIAQFDSW